MTAFTHKTNSRKDARGRANAATASSCGSSSSSKRRSSDCCGGLRGDIYIFFSRTSACFFSSSLQGHRAQALDPIRSDRHSLERRAREGSIEFNSLFLFECTRVLECARVGARRCTRRARHRRRRRSRTETPRAFACLDLGSKVETLRKCSRRFRARGKGESEKSRASRSLRLFHYTDPSSESEETGNSRPSILFFKTRIDTAVGRCRVPPAELLHVTLEGHAPFRDPRARRLPLSLSLSLSLASA